MLKFVRAVCVVALVGGMYGPALAQQSNTAPAQPPAQTTQSTVDMNEVVCQKQEVIGSRLAVKRICKTRAEWADSKMQDRQEIERVQTQRGMKGQ